ncbi:MAG: hypothetical protein JRJ47_13570 [Deltaproteobacteria bacterium]|nr:hypothetical protein [Deltaproteobacteria bacterium]
MKSEQGRDQEKQAYEKPRLRIIELAADEVHAIGCKTVSSPAPLGPNCPANGCKAPGS